MLHKRVSRHLERPSQSSTLFGDDRYCRIMNSVDDALSEAQSWYDANWSPDLALGEWWGRLGNSGWGFPGWPAKWFGRGLASSVARAVVSDRMRQGIFGPPTGIATFLAAPTILTHGTEDQKERFLPMIATGQVKWCQLFSEPNAGSDMASLQTRAIRDGDEWIINGQKVWSSGAHFADFGILIARTDSDVPKHKGITYFLINMRQPGIEVRPLREMTGDAAFNEVFFTDARIPDADRLEAPGEGWRVAMTTLANERDSNNPGLGGGGGSLIGNPDLSMTVAQYRSAMVTGVDAFSFTTGGGAPALFEKLVRDFGRTNDPVMRQRIASLKAQASVRSWTAQRAKAAAKAGATPGPETSTMKLSGTISGRQMRDAGLEAMGPHGMLIGDDAPAGGLFHKYALFVPATSIAGGSDEVQRNIIGERALGLPKEPDDSKDRPFRDVRVGTQTLRPEP